MIRREDEAVIEPHDALADRVSARIQKRIEATGPEPPGKAGGECRIARNSKVEAERRWCRGAALNSGFTSKHS